MKKEKVLKLLPFLLSTIATAICFFAFNDFVILNGASFESIFIIIIMLWTASLYNDKDYMNGSTLGTSLKEDERAILGKCIANSYVFLASLLIPTIFFFENWFKIIFPIMLVFLGIILGALIFRFKYSKQIKERIENEEKELKEQKDKEELGKV